MLISIIDLSHPDRAHRKGCFFVTGIGEYASYFQTWVESEAMYEQSRISGFAVFLHILESGIWSQFPFLCYAGECDKTGRWWS